MRRAECDFCGTKGQTAGKCCINCGAMIAFEDSEMPKTPKTSNPYCPCPSCRGIGVAPEGMDACDGCSGSGYIGPPNVMDHFRKRRKRDMERGYSDNVAEDGLEYSRDRDLSFPVNPTTNVAEPYDQWRSMELARQTQHHIAKIADAMLYPDETDDEHRKRKAKASALAKPENQAEGPMTARETLDEARKLEDQTLRHWNRASRDEMLHLKWTKARDTFQFSSWLTGTGAVALPLLAVFILAGAVAWPGFVAILLVLGVFVLSGGWWLTYLARERAREGFWDGRPHNKKDKLPDPMGGVDVRKAEYEACRDYRYVIEGEVPVELVFPNLHVDWDKLHADARQRAEGEKYESPYTFEMPALLTVVDPEPEYEPVVARVRDRLRNAPTPKGTA